MKKLFIYPIFFRCIWKYQKKKSIISPKSETNHFRHIWEILHVLLSMLSANYYPTNLLTKQIEESILPVLITMFLLLDYECFFVCCFNYCCCCCCLWFCFCFVFHFGDNLSKKVDIFNLIFILFNCMCVSLCVYMHTCTRNSQRPERDIRSLGIVTSSDVGSRLWWWELNFTSMEEQQALGDAEPHLQHTQVNFRRNKLS